VKKLHSYMKCVMKRIQPFQKQFFKQVRAGFGVFFAEDMESDSKSMQGEKCLPMNLLWNHLRQVCLGLTRA